MPSFVYPKRVDLLGSIDAAAAMLLEQLFQQSVAHDPADRAPRGEKLLAASVMERAPQPLPERQGEPPLRTAKDARGDLAAHRRAKQPLADAAVQLEARREPPGAFEQNVVQE